MRAGKASTEQGAWGDEARRRMATGRRHVGADHGLAGGGGGASTGVAVTAPSQPVISRGQGPGRGRQPAPGAVTDVGDPSD